MKYQVIQVTNSEMWDVIIKDCYMDSLYNDPDLLEKYAFNAPTNVDNLLAHTIETFNESVFFGLYSIWDGDDLVAYFGRDTISKDVQMITGFYIFKAYRNKEFVATFWDILKSKFGKNIYIGLWANNLPAQKFVKRAGFKHFSDMKAKGADCVVFKL